MTTTVLRCVLLTVLFLGARPAEVNAVEPLRVPDSAAPTFTVYNSRDGLSDEIWSTVGFDRDGFVWAGSASELARFDGYRWTRWPLPDTRSLVRDMASDSDGNLWAIFESEGLVRYDGQHWQRVGKPRFYQRFSTIQLGDKQQLWAAHDGGLASLVDGQWVEDAGNPDIPSARSISIARTERLLGGPREWMGGADNGVWYRELTPQRGPWQRFNQAGVREMAITDLLRSVADDGGEELWVVSYGGGVARVRNDGTRIWRADSGEIPSEAVYSAVETHNAAGERLIWMASRAGLLRFRGDRVEVFNRRNGLPSDAVRGLKVQRGADGVDTLWLATEGGLARATLADSPWHSVSLLGANENGTFGVLVEPDDHGGERLWVGSAKQGLALLEGGNWRIFSEANGALPTRSVRGLWRLPGNDGNDHRLLSLNNGPLLEIMPDLSVRPLPTPWQISIEEVANHMAARHTPDGIEWWTATAKSGVYRFRDGEWQNFPSLGTGSRAAQVNWIAEQIDASGRSWLWAADDAGLSRFDGNDWTRLPTALHTPAGGFRALLLATKDGRQTLWGGSTHQGIVRLDVTDPANPIPLSDSSIPAPPDPVIYSILQDTSERLYVCTNNGVQQLTPKANGDYVERVFHRRDGLIHDECNTNSQFVDSNNRYWVGTLGGLGMFDPSAQPPASAPQAKSLHFTEVRVDGKLLDLQPAGQIQLPAGSRELRIEYTLLTGLREDESLYQTHLSGFDPQPTLWSSEHSRTFSGLAPGSYEFSVSAQDFSGATTPKHLLLFSVPPLWWQQPWLQTTLFAALLLLAFVLVLGYNRGLRSRQKQLRQQVAARTEDLRYANARLTELSYLDPLTGIANRRRLIEAMTIAIERAASRQTPIGLIVIDVDHFKLFNDQHGHLVGDVSLRAVADALNSTLREQDLAARFGGEEFACLMIDADLETVLRVAERMRALVEALPPRSLGNDSQTMTISAGVLSHIPLPNERPEDLLGLADEALYRAKSAGRNRVERAVYRAS